MATRMGRTGITIDLGGTQSPQRGPPRMLPQTIPTLHSERLILRAFTQADFEPMARFYADPVSAFYGGPCGRDDAWRKFAAFLGHWALRGYGPWAMEEKASVALVGLSGLWYPEGWLAPEITWALVPGQHGEGFATEGALRALRSAYEDFGWTTAISVISVHNSASEAVALRMGAQQESLTEYRHGPAKVYRHLSPAA
ncbi:MAG: GNAT family N-acetyltransferase, partial [Hydrogenophaga sp.]